MKLQEMSVKQVVDKIISNIEDTYSTKEFTCDNDTSKLKNILDNQTFKYNHDKRPDRIAKDFDIKEVDKHGGEDQGSDYYTIWSINRREDYSDVVYIKIRGYYSSYNGTEYAEFDEAVKLVLPVEKTIIVYKEK